jgi:hypothetical protein
MAEQTSTTNPNRPPLFHVYAGRILKGSKVEILGTTNQNPLGTLKPTDQVWVREFSYWAPADQKFREATIAWRNLERAWRTKEEETLGREFTDDEAAEYDRTMKLRVAQHMVEHRAQSINDRLTQMAERLERATEDMRRLVANEGYTLDQKVYQAQHDLAWLFPNLGADSLTTDLVGWLQMDAEIKRLGSSSEEVTGS